MNAHPRMQVAACVTRYQSCTVDPRPGRAVHCPDLNACLVNEGRPEPVDCHAVHFGYAIPVSVLPLDEKPSFAELVLDSDTDLSPRTVAYLLDHHPQLRPDTVNEEDIMASTAPEEDIAAIAKQISDHAEAIYQTWKSRGLAPTEILSVHNTSSAVDKFGSALTPQPQVSGSKVPPVVDLNLDTNNLERLVSDFVVEDKARLAARLAKNSPKSVPSSIQYARQKFEKQPLPDSKLATSQSITIAKTQFEQTQNKLQPSKIPTAQYSRNSPTKSPYQRNVQLETIETILPPDLNLQKPHVARKITEIAENSPSSGLTTWPLKNKNIGALNEKRVSVQNSNENESKRRSVQEDSPSKFSSIPTNSKNTAEYLDEVAREEERLINALKTGIIIAEDPTVAKTSPTKKKSEILLKKNGEKDMQKDVTKTPRTAGSLGSARISTQAAQPSVNIRTTAVETKQTVVKSISKTSLSNMSTVDYAKERYRIAQQRLDDTPKCIDQKVIIPPEKTPQQVVPVSRNRFELAPKSAVVNESWVRSSTTEDGSKRTAPVRLRHPPLESVPHPELTSHQRHLRVANGANPVRPFLTRGSVAERVLIFEKCPTEILLDKRRSSPSINTWRSGHEVHAKAQTYSSRNKENEKPPNTTLQRHVKANRNVHIPRFYFPHGKPVAEQQEETILQRVSAVFQQFTNHQVPRDKFNLVVKACDCPLYWKVPLFIAMGGEKLGYVELPTFIDFWKKMTVKCHDQESRFIYILTKGQRDVLTNEDFIPLVQDVVDSHPGLTFLKEAMEFHSRYVHTVIARIFYCVNRSWSGRITLPELRRSNLLRVVQLLEEEEDINQVTAYFSYEHFYVIYCKFWELDQDHDLYIDQQDLQRHSDHALSSRMIERIFSGAVTRGVRQHPDKMSYTEFVWFLLSEEDKSHPTAIEYWFRCMDLDGDGYLSMYELEYFYEEQLQRMESIGIETLPFEDCLCQMLDMIHPKTPGKISLSDLKRCKMTPIFFDTFFNLEKYLDHEQRDPFASQRDHDSDGQELSDWDRYAAEEYELLVAEEGGTDQQEDMMYDDDMEGEDLLSPNLDTIVTEDSVKMNGHWKKPSFSVTDFDADEDGDYAGDSDDGSV